MTTTLTAMARATAKQATKDGVDVPTWAQNVIAAAPHPLHGVTHPTTGHLTGLTDDELNKVASDRQLHATIRWEAFLLGGHRATGRVDTLIALLDIAAREPRHADLASIVKTWTVEERLTVLATTYRTERNQGRHPHRTPTQELRDVFLHGMVATADQLIGSRIPLEAFSESGVQCIGGWMPTVKDWPANDRAAVALIGLMNGETLDGKTARHVFGRFGADKVKALLTSDVLHRYVHHTFDRNPVGMVTNEAAKVLCDAAQTVVQAIAVAANLTPPDRTLTVAANLQRTGGCADLASLLIWSRSDLPAGDRDTALRAFRYHGHALKHHRLNGDQLADVLADAPYAISHDWLMGRTAQGVPTPDVIVEMLRHPKAGRAVHFALNSGVHDDRTACELLVQEPTLAGVFARSDDATLHRALVAVFADATVDDLHAMLQTK